MKLFLNNPSLSEKLLEPSFEADGYTDPLVDETVVETFTYHGSNGADGDEVLVSRTVEYNAARDLLSATVFSVTNAPVIIDAETDADNDAQIHLGVATEISIEGSFFGAAAGDIEVFVISRPKNGCLGAHIIQGGLKTLCTITASEDVDTEDDATLTVTVTLEPHGQFAVGVGPAELYIYNTKRKIQSNSFPLSVVK